MNYDVAEQLAKLDGAIYVSVSGKGIKLRLFQLFIISEHNFSVCCVSYVSPFNLFLSFYVNIVNRNIFIACPFIQQQSKKKKKNL